MKQHSWTGSIVTVANSEACLKKPLLHHSSHFGSNLFLMSCRWLLNVGWGGTCYKASRHMSAHVRKESASLWAIWWLPATLATAYTLGTCKGMGICVLVHVFEELFL